MNTELIEYLRDFLSKNDIDGLLINSTNEFLVEYNMLAYNSRYYVTEFTGSTGDVLLTGDKIYLFVDPRYHEQAENEVDSEYIDVIKMPVNKSYLSELTDKIPAYYKLGIVSSKTSRSFYDNLVKNLSPINVTFKLFDTDPVYEFVKEKINPVEYKVFKVDEEITGQSADDKYETIKQYVDEEDFYILVTAPEDVAYITNMRSYDFDYSAIFPAKAIITKEGVSVYTDCNMPFIGEKYKVIPLNEYSDFVKQIHGSNLYIDNTSLTVYDYNLINQDNNIRQSHVKLFKTVKNDNEINHLKKCFERADNALKVIYNMINSETIYTEYDYYEALIKSMKENGALSLSFKPIVASGKNSSIVHYTNPSKDKKVEDGDLLLVDYGGYYEGGLATDTTRTFIKGDATEEQKKVYTCVLKAFLNAYYNKYDKKSAYFDIDKIARETIEKTLSNEYPFSHSTGHGVGICVHENPPRVSSGEVSKTKIKENTVFSVEPGAYKEGRGGVRIENTVRAKQEEDKIVLESFSSFPFEIKLTDLSLLNDNEKFNYMKWQEESCLL